MCIRDRPKPAAKPAGSVATLALDSSEPATQLKKKLSYLEAREYAAIEQHIADAERTLESKRAELQNPAIASDGPRLMAAHAEMEAAQKDLDALYSRWAELEQKAGHVPHSRTR